MLDGNVLDVFLCYAPADRGAAEHIALRLKHGSEASVWLEPCGAGIEQSLASAWDGGLSSAAILLLLSENSVPVRLPLDQWQPLLKHIDGNTSPPVAAVSLGPCPYPPLLDRKRFFRWSGREIEVLRKIERWVVSLHEDGPRSLDPARIPGFEGREEEMAEMWSTVVDQPGALVLSNPAPRSGKSALAQEFARVAGGHFRDLIWVTCGDRSLESLAGDLSGFSPEHRLLLVLDDVTGDLPFVLDADRKASILITTRRRHLKLSSAVCVLDLDPVERPLTPPELGPEERRLFGAMSSCRPQAFALDLAASIAAMDPADASNAAERLAAKRLIDPLDANGSRYRMAAPATAGPPLRRHAEVLQEIISGWRAQPDRSRRVCAEVEPALEWAIASDWNLAKRLAAHASAFLIAEERRSEAALLYIRLRDAARERRDALTVEECSWELSWLRDEQGSPYPGPAIGDQLAFAFS